VSVETLSNDAVRHIGQTLNEHRAGMNVNLIEAPDLEAFGSLSSYPFHAQCSKSNRGSSQRSAMDGDAACTG